MAIRTTNAPSIDLTSWARGLVFRFLVNLDAAQDCTEHLQGARRFSDVFVTLTFQSRLSRAWGDAYAAILVLEQVSRCPESNAWSAFDQARRRASFAWSDQTETGASGAECQVPAPEASGSAIRANG